MVLHIVLVEPEIPQNTGNIARTCAALGAELHLVEPLGFSLEDRYLRRAGLDYWSAVHVATHHSLADYRHLHGERNLRFATARMGMRYDGVDYTAPCSIVFGKETTGLPPELLSGPKEHLVHVPMRPGIRSLNLSNAVAVVAYEVYRKDRFPSLE